jgi:hypothetical protein
MKKVHTEKNIEKKFLQMYIVILLFVDLQRVLNIT